MPLSFFVIAVLQLATAPSTTHAVFRGRVATDAGAPVSGAEIVIATITDRRFSVLHADSAGKWTSDWPNGASEYLVSVSALGFARSTRRIVHRPDGRDSVFVVDVVLQREAVAALPTVVTTTARARPDRISGRGSDVGASETLATDTDLLSPATAGDLNAVGTLLPNVVTTAGGISVVGLGAAQNAVTLNGMAFAGSSIPRDLSTRVRVATSSYDPSIGWFSGARTNVQLAPGGVFSSRRMHLSGDAPALQASDPVAGGLGQRASVFDVSLSGDGPLVGAFTYNGGAQVTHRSADRASLGSASADLLKHAGIAPDSASRLIQLLGTQGLPSSLSEGATTSDHVVLLGRIDHAPYDWDSLRAARTTWGLAGYADLTRQDAIGRDVTAIATHTGVSDRRIGGLSAELSHYLENGGLATVRSGFSADHAMSTPDLFAPDGRVVIQSDVPGASVGGLASLAFGGNGALSSSSRRWTWESDAELELYPPGASTHRVKVAGDLRFDGFAQQAAQDALGTFSFNSLADLAAGRASSFTRTLGALTEHGREGNAFVSIGDLWRVAPPLQLLYGARLEGNAFLESPSFNPAIASVFGARTDQAPRALTVLPRAGFTFDVPDAGDRPAGSVRGGFGAFRNLLDPQLVAGPSTATGLPNGITRLACLGDAAPLPDWTAYVRDPGSIPDRCSSGATGVLDDSKPSVMLVDPDFAPPLSWRSNLSWSSNIHGIGYSIGAVYSDDRHQPDAIDLNFIGTSRFSLADEGRAVFVDPSSIVSTTGAVSTVDARRSASFGRVTRATSDLRGIGRQLTVLAYPPLSHLPLGGLIAETSLGYTLSSRRSQQTGFAGTTFGDPSVSEWARGDLDVRHRFVARTLLLPFGNRAGVGLVIGAQLQSGRPFTPMISGDVNGDGLANDRAFVHAATGNDALASGMRSLLASAPSRVRDCLLGQSGSAAGPNSCEGPWSAALDANLILGRGHVPALPSRAIVTASFTNVLGGIDQLLHGSDALRGWGTTPTPDPVLYVVRGFDASARQFAYQVNPRFGDTRAASTTQRAPFRLTLDVRIDIAPPSTQQQVDRWLQPGRKRPGTRLNAAELARRLEHNVPDPYAELLSETDSLLLTPAQVASLRDVQRRYRARMDSTWSATSQDLDALPDAYDASVAYRRTYAAVDAAWELTRLDVQSELPHILTAAQLTMLGGTAGQLWSSPFPVHDHRFIP